MAALGSYIVSVTAGAILCGIILSLVPEGGCRNGIRLLCGVFLTITALSPLMEIELPDWESHVTAYMQEGELLARTGRDDAMNTVEELIKQQTEAYILDKASRRGLYIEVSVSLKNGVPKTAVLKGSVREEDRTALAKILTDELGIAKECQHWIGTD